MLSTLPTAGYAGQQKSSIISMGLTIHNAPVELREKLAVPEAEWPRAIEELCSYPHIEEAAILSTCNRMELYVVAVSWHRGVREVGMPRLCWGDCGQRGRARAAAAPTTFSAAGERVGCRPGWSRGVMAPCRGGQPAAHGN